MRRLIILSCLLLALGLGILPSAAAQESSEVPRFEPGECRFNAPGGVDVECGDLVVLEDRADPESPEIRLHVGIFKSDSTSPAPDPIVYLEGGPGGSGLMQMEEGFALAFDRYNDDRDLIVIDQRGTGYSEPTLACPEVTRWTIGTLDEDLEPSEAIDQQLEQVLGCRERLAAEGVNLSAYNSGENAADIADLRVALGLDEWNLYGISYGTRLALTVLRDHPEGIRSVILDSSYPLEVDLFSSMGAGFDRALTVLFQACEDDPACAARFPDLEAVFYEITTALNQDPVMTQSSSLTTGETLDVLIDGDIFMGLVFQSLYNASVIPNLPQMIYDAHEGEFGLASLLVVAFVESADNVSTGMNLSVQCSEELPFVEPGTVEAASQDFPRLQEFLLSGVDTSEAVFDTCSIWNVTPRDEFENQAVSSDIPTLVMAGEYDPITPPAWGQLVAENLPNSLFIEFPSVGHGASVSDPCATEIALAFVDNPDQAPDDSCIAQMGGPIFAAEAGDITMVPFTSTSFGFKGAYPEGWTEIITGTYAPSTVSTTNLLEMSVPGNAGMIIGLLGAQIGVGEPMEIVNTREANGLTWDIYEAEGEIQGLNLAFRFATAEKDGTSYLIMIQTSPDEMALYEETVFYPAIDALIPLLE
jgi:pimeloyl-ACP methyl ester carboxylesterase